MTSAPGGEKLFKIQRGLAAVQLAGHRQIGNAVIKIRDLIFAHLGTDADELFGANAARIIVATVPLGAIFVMLAGSSTSRPHESMNMTVSAAGSSAGSSAGASVAAGLFRRRGCGSAGAGFRRGRTRQG